MSAGWIAGSVRARAMTRRRLGRVAARRLAAGPTIDAALTSLVQSPYGHDVRSGQTLAEAQRAVAATVVWNVRVLAGWAPREGVAMLRVLLGAVEAANVAEHVRRMSGADTPPPFRLGLLGTAWVRVATTIRPDEVRRVLATSPWGDPGGETLRDITCGLRLSLADRVIAAVPQAAPWAVRSAALLVARELFVDREDLPGHARVPAARVLGSKALTAPTLPDFVAALPLNARATFDGVTDPDQLWQADARWWAQVERDALVLARHPAPGPEVLIGSVALMATDAWRVRGALELAMRGGMPLEAFDAVA